MDKNKNAAGGLPPESQSHAMLYRMRIKFIAGIDVLAKGLGLPEMGIPEIDGIRLSADGAAELVLEQTAPFVPDAATLGRYAEILETSYNAATGGRFRLRDTKFAGYDEFLAMDLPALPAKPQEPFGVHVSYDGNFVSADDGSDRIVQMPCRPEEARALALRLFTDTMDEANGDPDGYADRVTGGEAGGDGE